ncbi:MAG: DUF2721 domain-containing protein [Methylobacter sp.]|nr:DUF2721 domain-containing protein [Methylobacter sp.]
MVLHFDYASANATTSSKRPTATATRGSSYTAPLALRFLYFIANRIREQHNIFNKSKSQVTKKQIDSLRYRIRFIVAMQLLAVIDIICCILAMGLIFYGLQYYGNITFGFSMAFIVLSLLPSVSELLFSTKALNIELEDMEEQ